MGAEWITLCACCSQDALHCSASGPYSYTVASDAIDEGTGLRVIQSSPWPLFHMKESYWSKEGEGEIERQRETETERWREGEREGERDGKQ